jgi:hypothetical protein
VEACVARRRRAASSRGVVARRQARKPARVTFRRMIVLARSRAPASKVRNYSMAGDPVASRSWHECC